MENKLGGLMLGYVTTVGGEETTMEQVQELRKLGANIIYFEDDTDIPNYAIMLDKIIDDYASDGDTIVTCSLSQIAYDKETLAVVLEYADQYGIAFVSLQEGIDTRKDGLLKTLRYIKEDL